MLSMEGAVENLQRAAVKQQAVAGSGPGSAVQAAPVAPLRRDPLAPTIFHQPWWLEIATGGRYGVAEFAEGGRVVGRMPYILRRRRGFTESRMPPQTHFLGPAIDPGPGSATTVGLRRQSITRELIRSLPPASVFRQVFHRGVTDVIPFQAAGYQTLVQFTYEIAPQATDPIWQAMRDKTRNTIRKARQQFAVHAIADPEAFTSLYARDLQAKGRTDPIDLSCSAALIAACLERGCGRILAARDANGTIAAGVVCIWDADASYYFLSTRDPSAGGAVSLLLWHFIQDASQAGRIFDFAGLAHSGFVHLYAGFGGIVRPRYIASRTLPWRLARGLHRLLGHR